MAGPLTKVGTKIAAINLDISRKLNWGRGLTLEFIVVDRTQLDDWRILMTLTKSFDRVGQSEKTDGDGSDVTIEVADLSGTLWSILRTKGLYIRIDGNIYGVSKVPPLAPNEAQVFTLMCKTHTLRANFDTTK